MSSHALHSLYGGKASRSALSGNVGAQVRLQEVRTPDWILEAVESAFGQGIYYDPCAASSAVHHFAEINDTLPREAQDLVDELSVADGKAERKRLNALLKPHYQRTPGHLPLDRMFMNPPFGHLEPWMRFAASGDDERSVSLVPVRTHRQWWNRHAAGAYGVWLAPFPFVGCKQAFPAPIALLSRNCELPPLGKRETGRFRLGGV